MARFLPFDYAFGFAQGKLFRCGAVEMTRFELATPVFEQIPGFYAGVYRRIIGIIKLADLPDFFLDQPPKTL